MQNLLLQEDRVRRRSAGHVHNDCRHASSAARLRLEALAVRRADSLTGVRSAPVLLQHLDLLLELSAGTSLPQHPLPVDSVPVGVETHLETNQSINLLISHSINQSVNHFIGLVVLKEKFKPIGQLIDRSINQYTGF